MNGTGQTRTLVKEFAPRFIYSNIQHADKDLGMCPRKSSTPWLTDWLTDWESNVALTLGRDVWDHSANVNSWPNKNEIRAAWKNA